MKIKERAVGKRYILGPCVIEITHLEFSQWAGDQVHIETISAPSSSWSWSRSMLFRWDILESHLEELPTQKILT